MSAIQIFLVLASAAAAPDLLFPVVRDGPGWDCERSVSVAFVARVVEQEPTDSPRVEAIQILRGAATDVPERVQFGRKIGDWRGFYERVLLGFDSQGALVCRAGESSQTVDDDIAFPVGEFPTTRGSPERLDARVRYLEHVWRLLEEPRVSEVLALLESDDLAARSAAHSVLAMVPSGDASAFWRDVGRVLVRQLPREPSALSEFGKSRFAGTLGRAVSVTNGFSNQPELRTPAARLLADMAVPRDRVGTCFWLTKLGHPQVCERDANGLQVASSAGIERLRRELGSAWPK